MRRFDISPSIQMSENVISRRSLISWVSSETVRIVRVDGSILFIRKRLKPAVGLNDCPNVDTITDRAQSVKCRDSNSID